MAVMAMHNKNILHRDIKTQNIFIDDKGVHKLGDFGISRELKQDAKAMTACGTPYFMPPEVCLGKPYDSKADVWAIGVIIYELIMLKKPFRGEQIYNVLQAITKCSYDPLDEDCDPNLQMIVFSLLQKDFNKRPSIFEVANLPCVRKEILDYIEESGCNNEVLEIIDFINPVQQNEEEEKVFVESSANNNGTITNNVEAFPEPAGQALQEPVVQAFPEPIVLQSNCSQGSDNRLYEMQNLWEWADIMHKDINLRDFKNGWFGKHTKCCQGSEILAWLTDKGKHDQKKAINICNKLVEQSIIISLEGKTFFGQNDLYRFHFDKDHIADNMMRNWRQEPGDAYEVSIQLVKRAEELYSCAIIQDEEGDPVVDVDLALKSNEYKTYINAIC